MTDQAIRGASKWGSDLATVSSNCGAGTQLLVSDSGDAPRDSLRAFEIPDRDPLPVSAAAEFDGRIVALWQESGGNGATAIMEQNDNETTQDGMRRIAYLFLAAISLLGDRLGSRATARDASALWRDPARA